MAARAAGSNCRPFFVARSIIHFKAMSREARVGVTAATLEWRARRTTFCSTLEPATLTRGADTLRIGPQGRNEGLAVLVDRDRVVRGLDARVEVVSRNA